MLRFFFKPCPTDRIFLDPSSLPSVSQLSLTSATLRQVCATLCTQFFTLIPVLDLMAKKAFIPADLHRPSCTRCLVDLYLLPRPLSAPESLRLKYVSAISSPVYSSPFLVPLAWFKCPCQPLRVISSCLRPSSEISLANPSPSPPCRSSTMGLSPSGTEGVCAYVPNLLPFSILRSLHPLLCRPVSCCFLRVVFFVCAPFCEVFKGLGVSTACQSTAPALIPTVLGHFGAIQAI